MCRFQCMDSEQEWQQRRGALALQMCHSSTADALYLNGFCSCVRALAVQHGLLSTHMCAESRRSNGFVHCLCKADVALDVGQCLQLRRKLLQLRQAPLRGLRPGTQPQWRLCLARSALPTEQHLQLSQSIHKLIQAPPTFCPCIDVWLHQLPHSGLGPDALQECKDTLFTGRSRSRGAGASNGLGARDAGRLWCATLEVL